jgi:hypothetical protein
MRTSDGIGNELRLKLANYKRTRAMLPAALRPWCDALIRETERQLELLTTAVNRPAPRGEPGRGTRRLANSMNQ